MTAIWASLVVALAAPPGSGRVRVCIAPFSGGPGAVSVREQVSDAVCAGAECVLAAKVFVKGKPSWARARSLRVRFVLTGKVDAAGRFLSLKILQAPGRPVLSRDLPLEGGRVEVDSFDGAQFAMLRAMGIPASAPGEQGTQLASAKSTAAVQPAVAPPPRGEEKIAMAPRVPEPAPRAPPPPSIAVPAGGNGRPAWGVEVGTDLLSRRLGYSQLTSGTLNPYRMDFIPKLAVRGEYSPLASSDGFLSGLRVDLGVDFTRLQSSLGTGPSYGTTYLRLDVDAGLDLPVGDLSLTPLLGLRRESFGTEPANDGSMVPGVPAVAYLGAVAGARAEMRVGAFTVFGRAAFLWNFDSGEIVSATYFAQGSSLGLDLSLGAGVPVPWVPRLELRATASMTWYALSFSTAPTDPYVGSGASDVFFGAGMSLRYAF